MRINFYRLIILVIPAIILTIPIFAAIEKQPTKISMMTSYYATEPIDSNNVIWKEMEERTNTKLDISFIPMSNYDEKVNIMIAANSLPEVTLVNNPFTFNIMSMALNGEIWELTEVYKRYPELAQYPNETWRALKYVNGKNYVLPRVKPTIGGTPMLGIRKDWLDRLGMKLPRTTDELYTVLKAFVEKDPDGDGVKDTVGLVAVSAADGTSLEMFNGILGAFTHSNIGTLAPRGYWMLDKEKNLQSAVTSVELRNAIIFLRRLYKEGLLYKDFATMTRQQMRDFAMSGKVGAVGENIPGTWTINLGIKKIHPNANLIFLPYLCGPNGIPYAGKTDGYGGGWVIRKKGVSKEKFHKILAFFNQTSSKELFELANYGYKNIHYYKKGDLYIQTKQAKKDLVGTVYMGNISCRFDKYFYAYNAPNITPEAIAYNKKAVDQQMKVAVPDYTSTLISDTWSKYEKEYNKKITDKILMTILGMSSIQEWDWFAKKITSEDLFQKGVKEMQAALKLRL
jgi:putative aldouronate transport system substrate-binding protein